MNNSFENDNNKRILMIDDDVKLCRLVTDYLAPFGFAVASENTGLKGLETARNSDFHAVILDVMLPEMDGFTILKEIRQFSDVPVLMLTALGDESDRIVGLEIGADDYLPKTFSTRELLARLRAVTRRSQLTAKNSVNETDEVSLGNLYINAATREVLQDGEALSLTALEFDLLLCLARSAGRVLDRDKLLDEVAGRSYDVFDRSVDVHISLLRRKLGDDPKNPRYIKTIRSVGYMLVPQEKEG
ncbi:MAG: response regulator transcription factor [Pyrinomonadaceae bacterium]|nr:response regulator transcription factor [Pyrinomonadaceae bacterium]